MKQRQPWQIFLLYAALCGLIFLRGSDIVVLYAMFTGGGFAKYPELLTWLSVVSGVATVLLALVCMWLIAARKPSTLGFVRGYGFFLLAGILLLQPINMFFSPIVLFCGYNKTAAAILLPPDVAAQGREEMLEKRPLRKVAAGICAALFIILMAISYFERDIASDKLWLMFTHALSFGLLLTCLYLFIVYTRRTDLSVLCAVLCVFPVFLGASGAWISTISAVTAILSCGLTVFFIINTAFIMILNKNDQKRHEA